VIEPEPDTAPRGTRRPPSGFPLEVSLKGQEQNTTLRSAQNFSPPPQPHRKPNRRKQRAHTSQTIHEHIFKAIISIEDIYNAMAKQTARDRCWNRILSLILKGGVVGKADLTKPESVSDRTAADLLHTMEEMGWIKRDPVPGPKPDKWRQGQQLPATLHTESE